MPLEINCDNPSLRVRPESYDLSNFTYYYYIVRRL